MKKLFALLAVVLAVASCQKESNDLAVNMGEQETLITVALPEATRANSALGGLDNNVRADHQLRYILEIYSDGGNECLRNVKFAEGEKTEVVFNVRLVPGHAYDFVVWADFVKNGEDTYYNTANGLDEISFKNYDAMTEARDAYYNVVSIEAGEPVSKVNTITLTRPFAKVRVVADDVDEAKAALHNSLTEATVTYTDDVVVYNTFNARTQDVSVTGEVSKEKTFFYNTSAYDESNLYVDYILVPQGTQSTVKFDLNVDGFVNRAFKTDIAVEANKLTTIKGNILTNGSDITVDVNDDFASETIYLEGDVTLTEDLVIDRPMVVRKGATAVLDLNGFNITNKTKNDAYGEDEAIIVYGNLTIKGQGTVTANSMAVWARGKGNNAVVNIYGGTYYGCAEGFANSGRSVIYASGGNTINIYGGKFQALAEDTTSFNLMENGRGYAAVNVEDKNNNIISVYGGSFYKQNPADPRTENPARSFVAEGYVSVENGDWFEVVYTGGEAVQVMVNNASELNTALDNPTVTNIYLKAGEYGTIKAKSNKTIIGSPEAKVDVVNLNGASNLKLKNINFDASKAVRGYDGSGNQKQRANIISRDLAGKDIDSGRGIVIDGCTFSGSHPEGSTSIAFTDQKRATCGDITIQNCIFEADRTFYNIYMHYSGGGYFKILNNTFKTAVHPDAYPIYLGRYSSSIAVEVKGNKFEVVTSESKAMAIQDHSNYGVSFDASNNTYAN